MTTYTNTQLHEIICTLSQIVANLPECDHDDPHQPVPNKLLFMTALTLANMLPALLNRDSS